MAAEDITLTVDGKIYGGWKSAGISRGIEQVAGKFTLGVTERWPGQPERRELRAGQECAVRIGNEIVVTGRIDEVKRKVAKGGVDITVTGRDRTGYMVDCSAPTKPSEWSGVALGTLARALATPFGVSVSVAVAAGKPFEIFALQPGETAFAALSRACRQRAVLAIADGAGGLVITRGGTVHGGGVLEEGEQRFEGDWRDSWQERYSHYTVQGQGGGWSDAADNAEGRAMARDGEITVYRPLVLIAEDQGDGVTMAERAAWEARTRKAKGRGGSVTAPGWRNSAGKLWQPNTLVRVIAPAGGVTGDLLISSVQFSLSKQDGTTTQLELVGKHAFDLLPEKGGSDGWM